MRGTQLSFAGLDIKKEASLQDFYAPSFTPILSSVYEVLYGSVRELFLSGESGTGKTHLLSAIYKQYLTTNNMAILLSVGEVLDDANALSGLEMFSLILLDDIHLIGGRADWQEALFHLINRARVNDCKLIYTANVPAQALDLQLLDLTTRLAQALQFALPNGAHLADRQAVLDAILKQKGWQLPDSIKSYFVEEGPHLPADMVKVLSAITPYFKYKGRRLPQKLFDDIKKAIQTQSLLMEIADINFASDNHQPALPFEGHND